MTTVRISQGMTSSPPAAVPQTSGGNHLISFGRPAVQDFLKKTRKKNKEAKESYSPPIRACVRSKNPYRRTHLSKIGGTAGRHIRGHYRTTSRPTEDTMCTTKRAENKEN